MKVLQSETKGMKRVKQLKNHQGMELLLFLVASAIGVFALGNGLTGLFEPGKGIDLLWLAITVTAMMILFAQMGRVRDTWPSRKTQYQQVQPGKPDGLTSESGAQIEERER